MPFCPTHSLTTLLLDLQVPVMRKQEEGIIVICFISPVADNDIRIRVYQDNLSGTSFLDGECLSLQLSPPLLLPLRLELIDHLLRREYYIPFLIQVGHDERSLHSSRRRVDIRSREDIEEFVAGSTETVIQHGVGENGLVCPVKGGGENLVCNERRDSRIVMNDETDYTYCIYYEISINRKRETPEFQSHFTHTRF